ncbi:hypothetical protein ACOMHN_042975 [Nucella lapillus]
MDTIVILLLFLVPVLARETQTSLFLKARDYLSIASENYPDTYPGPDSWRWRWSVDSGLWAVVFLDFQLDCDHHDTLVISDPGRNLTFSCGNRPSKQYAYFIQSSSFSVQLFSNGQAGQLTTRRFRCQVLYGTNRGKLQSKIDDMKTSDMKTVTEATEESSSLASTTVFVVLLLLIVPLVIIVGVIGGIMILRRRQLHPSTNTSVHLNIGAIRRDSSVSYTRNGNGPPAGGRPRMDSAGSMSPDSAASATRPKRPVKRSESNSSWAMRAEMNTSGRHGSFSNEGQGHNHGGGGGGGHGGRRATPNFYGPCPGESAEDLQDFIKSASHYKRLAPSVVGSCRLSTICEECSGGSSSRPISSSSGSCDKLSASFPVPVHCQAEESSLAIANAGYMLMTSCSANYVNMAN